MLHRVAYNPTWESRTWADNYDFEGTFTCCGRTFDVWSQPNGTHYIYTVCNYDDFGWSFLGFNTKYGGIRDYLMEKDKAVWELRNTIHEALTAFTSKHPSQRFNEE